MISLKPIRIVEALVVELPDGNYYALSTDFTGRGVILSRAKVFGAYSAAPGDIAKRTNGKVITVYTDCT